MNAIKFIYGLIHPLGIIARFTLWGGGSGGGGGGTQQSTNTTYQTNIPEYAKPYVETMLGATQKQLFQGTPTEGGGFDITGFQPYRAYGGTYDAAGNQTSYDPGKSIAGFQPMQQQAQQGIANMRTPEQYGQAMGITGQGIMGGLGTAGQGVGLAGMGYQTAGAGDRYAQQATNPYAMQAYMSPYMQNVVDVQQREAQRQADIASTGRNAQAVQAGAFGGSRQAITDAEAARNLALQKGDIQATGLQSAYQQAQQAQQYGANLGLQGMQAGMQGVGAGIGAQQAGYGQAMSGAQNLAGLGQQQLASQQGIYSLQNTTGAQQQALEQQKINQSMQDFANAQQYPLMQLGTMSNMLRGLPMQASTTNQYVAAPNSVTQAIGAVGAGTSLYNALKGAEGGLPSEFKQSGIMSFSAGGISNDVEHDLYSMDEDDLQRQLKESSSPSVKRMAQRILRMKQMENQQPGMAGGGIIAFGEGELVPPPTSSEVLQQRVMQGKPTGDVMTQPQGIVQASAPVPPKPLTAAQAIQEAPEIPTALKGMYNDATTEFNKPVNERIAAIQQAKKEAGITAVGVEQREKLMAERANADDEARRNRYLRAAEFFAQWGSTPGPTLSAGLNALKERVPDIISDEKEAKKARMEIDKAIAGIDEATRLESKGDFDAAIAEKQKWADRMQGLNTKMIELEETEKRTQAQESRARIRAEAEAVKSREHDISVERMRKDVQDSVNKTQLEAERIRSGAMRESKEAANETNKLTRLQAAAQLQANVYKSIEMEKSKPTYEALLRTANMPENPESLPMITNAKTELAKREVDFNRMRKDAKDTVDYIKVQTGMIPPTQAAPTAGNRPQVKGAAARGAPPRAPIDSFYNK